jgi:hypothetical protein
LPAGVEFIDVQSALGIYDAPQTHCVGERVLAPTQQGARTPSLRRKTAPGEVAPEDLSGNRIVRLGLATGGPQQYEANTGQRDQGKRPEARDALAPVYGWFTEGFGTPVLQEAKALLDELS